FVFRDIYNQDNDDPTSFTCQAPKYGRCRSCLNMVIKGGIRAAKDVSAIYDNCDVFFTRLREQLIGQERASNLSNRSFILITDIISTCITQSSKQTITNGTDDFTIFIINTNGSNLNKTIVMDNYGYFYQRQGMFSLIYVNESSEIGHYSRFLNWCPTVVQPVKMTDKPDINSNESEEADEEEEKKDHTLEAVFGSVIALGLLGIVCFLMFKFLRRSRKVRRMETVR
uniref:Receptor ligand binding region domain-containing protein n=1 Tax=Plectus sambesii TaxID=2011161 RepID=A0A914VEP6_9BILA